MESTYQIFLELILLIFYLVQIETAALSRCLFGEYWNKNLEVCRSCLIDVCTPLSRPVCKERCEDFFLFETSKKSAVTTQSISTITNSIFHAQTGTSQTGGLNDHFNITGTTGIVVAVGVGFMVIVAIAIFLIVYLKNRMGRNQAVVTRRRDADQNEIERQPLQADIHLAQSQDSGVREKEDDKTSIWSGRAVYDVKNNCIEIKGTDRLMKKEMGQSHSL